MASLTFTIYIFAIMLALIFAYAYLMSILQREPNSSWLQAESALLFLSSIGAGLLFVMNFESTSNDYIFLSKMALSVATLTTAALLATTFKYKAALLQKKIVLLCVSGAAFLSLNAHTAAILLALM